MPANIILGTVQFGLDYGINNREGKPAKKTVFEILEQAHQSGIQTLDTADGYGDAADVIGNFHRETGIRFAVNTKFTGGTGISAGFEKTVARLGITQVETFFFHHFKDYRSFPGMMDELNSLKSSNKILKTGLSVYGNDEFEMAINDDDIDVIQLPFNLLDNYSQRGALLQKAKGRGKIIQIRSVFLQGLFFKPLNGLPEQLLPLMPVLKELRQLAEENKVSMETLCIKYASAHTEIDELIIGVDNVSQLKQNMAAINSALPDDVVNRIDSLQVTETALLYPYNWNKN